MDGFELTIGRVVHFRSPLTDGKCWPAMVAGVGADDVVTVSALAPDGSWAAADDVEPEPADPELGPTWHTFDRHGPALVRPPAKRPALVAPEDPNLVRIRELEAELEVARKAPETPAAAETPAAPETAAPDQEAGPGRDPVDGEPPAVGGPAQ